VKQYVNVIMIA